MKDFFTRLRDVVLAALILLIMSPVMLAIAALIYISNGDSVFFSQKRIGRGGKVFQMHKFRSMKSGTKVIRDDLPLATDPRVTKIGFWLRRTNLDELPQLWNVLKGEMSFVGPRPEIADPLRLGRFLPKDLEIRMKYRPGITGIWQAKYKGLIPMYDSRIVILEKRYYEKANPFWHDLVVMAMTVIKLAELFNMERGKKHPLPKFTIRPA